MYFVGIARRAPRARGGVQVNISMLRARLVKTGLGCGFPYFLRTNAECKAQSFFPQRSAEFAMAQKQSAKRPGASLTPREHASSARQLLAMTPLQDFGLRCQSAALRHIQRALSGCDSLSWFFAMVNISILRARLVKTGLGCGFPYFLRTNTECKAQSFFPQPSAELAMAQRQSSKRPDASLTPREHASSAGQLLVMTPLQDFALRCQSAALRHNGIESCLWEC